MKNLLKLDFKTLLIAVLIIVILLLKMCTPKPTPNPGEIIKIDGKKYEVIKRIRDTQYITKTHTIYKPGETIYVEKPIYVDVPSDVDTGEILKDYFAKYTYKDTIKLEDSLGTVQITDTIQKNKIVSRTFKSNINQVHVRDSIIVKELPKPQLYVGGIIGADRKVGFNYFGPTFVLKTKSDNMYSLGVGLNNNFTTSIQAGVYWKIKLKK
jgi:hypothetical protein